MKPDSQLPQAITEPDAKKASQDPRLQSQAEASGHMAEASPLTMEDVRRELEAAIERHAQTDRKKVELQLKRNSAIGFA